MAFCSSCGRETSDYTKFPCPNASCNEVVVRCKPCRENEVSYECCGFKGP
ncbi:MAG: hypothetical protein ACP5O3_00905 [Candidatus Micrarchaeia archaeon]